MTCPNNCAGDKVRPLTPGECETVEAVLGPKVGKHTISSFERCSYCCLVFKDTYLDTLPLQIKAGHLNSDITGDGFVPIRD